MSSSDSTEKTKEKPPPSSEEMKEKMKYFFTKIFVACIGLGLLLGIIYWGVDTTVKTAIMKVFTEEFNIDNVKTGKDLPWTNVQYDPNNPTVPEEEDERYFWAKFRKIIIQGQLAVFFFLWLAVTLATSLIIRSFSINVSAGKLMGITLACYLGVVFPLFLVLAYTEIFNKIFEKYRLPSEYDDGYNNLGFDDTQKNTKEENVLFGKKFKNILVDTNT